MRSRTVCLAVAAALSMMLWSAPAQADLDNDTHNGIRGAVGLGLIGAELPLIIQGAIGVRNPWLLSLIPIAVAAGGAVGGYYMGVASPEASVATLVLGLALIIPAAILVAHGRSYRSSRDEDSGFIDRTEEGMPDDSTSIDITSNETSTEVVGPEGQDTFEEVNEEPEDDDAEPGDGVQLLNMNPISLASVQLDGSLPVGGMLRLFVETSGQRVSHPLSLRVF